MGSKFGQVINDNYVTGVLPHVRISPALVAAD